MSRIVPFEMVDAAVAEIRSGQQWVKTWALYWRDRNLRFHRYDRINPSENVSTLIDEIDRVRRTSSWADPAAA